MHRKHVWSWVVALTVILVLSSLIVGVNRAYMSSQWTPGKGWGYKWDMDMSDIADAMNEYGNTDPNMTISASGAGHIISVLYIEYEGKDSDGYRFMYEGRDFTEDAVLSVLTGIQSSGYSDYEYHSNMKMDMNINKIDSNFKGKFWLKEYTEDGTTYYGISKQTIDSMGYVIDASMKMTGSSYSSYSGEQSYNINASIKYDLTVSDFEITYSPPIPYLPYEDSSCNLSVYSIGISYNGSVTGEYSYSMSGNAPYFNGSSGSGQIDTTLNGSDSLYSPAELNYDSSTGIAEKPMPIAGAGSLISPGMGFMGGNSVYVNGYSALMTNRGKLSGGFYEKMTPSSLSSINLGIPQKEPSPDDWSVPASKSDVENIKNSSDPLGNGGFPLWIIIVLVVAAAVIVVLAIYGKRRRSAPMQSPPQYPEYPYARETPAQSSEQYVPYYPPTGPEMPDQGDIGGDEQVF